MIAVIISRLCLTKEIFLLLTTEHTKKNIFLINSFSVKTLRLSCFLLSNYYDI